MSQGSQTCTQVKTQFEMDLEKLINKHSLENSSNTPDYILAKYLYNCLDNFNRTIKEREEWHDNGTILKLVD